MTVPNTSHASTLAPLPPRAQRIERAITRGYLTTSGYVGMGRWFDECWRRQLPFAMVIKDRRHWRVTIEMLTRPHSLHWTFTRDGELALLHLAAEHNATKVMSGADHFRATLAEQAAAEEIAASVIHWVRRVMADQQAELPRTLQVEG